MCTRASKALMTGARLDTRRKLAGAHLGRQHRGLRARLRARGRGGARHRARRRARIWLRALMAELERLANHFGDIGAICNDASFSLMHAAMRHPARARAARRGRLLRPPADDGPHRAGRRRRRSRRRRRGCHPRAARDRCAARFPATDRASTTTPPRCRTAPSPPAICAPTLARQFGAGGYVGRASGRAFDARTATGLCALRRARRSRCRCATTGDVNARVWIRIREVEQSLRLIEQIARPAAARGRCAPSSASRAACAKASRWSKASAATCWSGCGSAPTARSRAAICATRPGSNGRCWKRRSRATSSPTSRSATNPSTAPIRATISRRPRMRSTLLQEPDARAR